MDEGVMNESALSEVDSKEEQAIYPSVKQAFGLAAIGVLVLLFISFIGYEVVKGQIAEQMKQAQNLDPANFEHAIDIMIIQSKAGTQALFYLVSIMLVAGLGSYGAELFYGLNKKKIRLKEAFKGPEQKDWKTFGLVLAGMILLSGITSYFIKDLYMDEILSVRPLVTSTFQKTTSDVTTWVLIPGVILTVFMAPFFEELVYRRIILDGFLQQYATRKAILLSALIFAIIHFNIRQMVPVFISGLLLGYLYERTKSVVFCMIAHFVYNLMGTWTIVYMFWGGI